MKIFDAKFLKLNKRAIIALIFSIALGYVVGYQINAQRKIEKIKSENIEENLAVEVASLIKANDSLSKQLDELNLQRNKLEQDAANSSSNVASIQSDLSRYKVIMGQTEVRGEGIVININEPLLQTQIVDLVNALKNIGYDSLAINDKRIIYTDGFGASINPPATIKVIGNKSLLKDGLVRAGGILEQTNINASIAELDEVIISAKNN